MTRPGLKIFSHGWGMGLLSGLLLGMSIDRYLRDSWLYWAVNLSVLLIIMVMMVVAWKGLRKSEQELRDAQENFRRLTGGR